MGTLPLAEQDRSDEVARAPARGATGNIAVGDQLPAQLGPGRMLALQRSAGNAAVGRLLGAHGRRLDRCGCGGGAGKPCGCTSELEEFDEEGLRRRVAVGNAIQRAVAQRASAQAVQRMPAYSPNPTWSQRGRDNPLPTCTPFFGAFGRSPEAEAKWQLYASVLPGQITARCGCSLVGDAYARYLSAVGGTVTKHDDGNCISEQLAQEASAHASVEAARLAAWAPIEDDFIRRSLPAGTTDAELDLLEATEGGNLVVVGAQPARRLQVDEITYTHNTLAGGLLFGGGHDPGDPPDSECGNDSRVMTASVRLHRTDNGSNPAVMAVTETFTFRYLMHDGFDFCPGNTIQMQIHPIDESSEVTQQRLEYNQLLTDLSRLEASGMARDVCFDVEYHRTLPVRTHSTGLPPTGPVIAATGSVVADALHVRSGPGTSFSIVRELPTGTSLTFDCFTHGESVRGDDAWCRIAGTSTWVAHSFIADSGGGNLSVCP